MTMVMSDISYTATRLKAELLGVLDRVQATGEPVVVTKHGRPVARIVPMDDVAPLAGSVRFLVDDDELLAPIDAAWDAESA
jgi:prevent-host-death family protein